MGFNPQLLSTGERLAVIRFCLSVGTRAEFHTRGCIVRPLDMGELERAHKEWDERFAKEGRSMSIRENYHIAVGYGFVDAADLNFHKSLNPRVTFGYSNVLTEAVDVVLDEKLRAKFIFCFEKESDIEQFDNHSYGAFENGRFIYYEDLIIHKGDKEILNTLSHEKYFIVNFDDGDTAEFLKFENARERNQKILDIISGAVNKKQ